MNATQDKDVPLLAEDVEVLNYIMMQCESASSVAKRKAPTIPLDQLRMLIGFAQKVLPHITLLRVAYQLTFQIRTHKFYT